MLLTLHRNAAWLSACFALLAATAPASADMRLPIPGAALNPTSPQECRAVSDRWSQILKELNDRHEVCLQSSACKNSGSSHGYRGVCTCGACNELHIVRNRYSSGALAQVRHAQEKECNAAVAAHQEEQRRQRQAAEEAQRRQRQAFEEAQRQYNESLRQQQSAMTQAQRENQRRLQANLQEQQRLLGESQRGFTALAEPARPTSVIGNVVFETKRQYDGMVRAKEQIKTTIDAINAIWGSGSVKTEAREKILTLAANSAPATLGELLTPKRNDYQDKGFDAFFDRVKSRTVDMDPTRTPVIGAIQDTAAGALRSQFQQTLGDMDQLQRQITNFSANDSPPPSGYSTGFSSPSAFRPNVPTGGTGSENTSQSGETAAAQDEFDSVRRGLGAAVINSGVESAPLLQLTGLDAPRGDGSCDYLSRPGQGRHASGQTVCQGGNMYSCEAGAWRQQGACSSVKGWQSRLADKLEK